MILLDTTRRDVAVENSPIKDMLIGKGRRIIIETNLCTLRILINYFVFCFRCLNNKTQVSNLAHEGIKRL